MNENIKGSNIFYPEPIILSTLIMDIIDKGKTIWETKTKELDNIKEIFNSIIEVIENYKEGKNENI